MNVRRLWLLAALVLPAAAFGQRKEIQELQREMGLLSEQLRTIERSMNDRLAGIQVLIQQTLDSVNKANTTVAVLESGFRDRFREQEKNVMAPIAGVNTKVDQMANEFGALKETVADTNARLGKLQQQIVDLSNAVKTMQAPAPPPPGMQSSAPGAPPIPAEVLYNNALRDRSGGKTELAIQQFRDYLQYYGNTELAPNAQFYIAEILYSQGELEKALPEFDAVLERFPENDKTVDALFMKGQTLVKMGRRTAGAQEYREVVRRFPRTDFATKARAQLKAMGLSVTAPASSKRK
jgi:tol-pal system protein YbgF